MPPDSALRQSAFGMKCPASGGRAKSAPERRHAPGLGRPGVFFTGGRWLAAAGNGS